MKKIALRLLGLSVAGLLSTFAFSADRVVYGEDNRREVYETTNDTYLKLATATAMLMDTSDLRSVDADTFAFRSTQTFGESYRLCQSEPYREQVNPGWCSGFLVGPDTFVTAGHCITDAVSCSTTSIVFDFAAQEDGFSPATAAKSSVYKCSSIISRKQSGGLDYAVIKLDRTVTDREPVQFRRNGTVSTGTSLVMIGHPAGLPTKIDDGGIVRDNSNPDFFLATTDSYGGNSGSAVFNAETGEVEGILVRGDTDFVTRNGCTVTNYCPSNGCSGEGVSRAAQFARFVP